MRNNYRKIVGIVGFLAVVFCSSPVLIANLEWELKKELDVGATPLDVATSLDGEMIFLLVPGEVLVYSPREENITDRIPVEEGFDQLAYSIKDNTLILTSKVTNTMNVIHLEIIHDLTTSGLPYKGPSDAPVTIAVFSDYQCPFCARLSGSLEQLVEKYPKDAKLVFKSFPLSIHKSAKEAAIAALAANKQGKYWELHDKLFANYKTLDDEKIREFAREIGLDMEEFERDMKSQELQNLIVRDVKEAKEAGVRGTPTVFINGKLVKKKTTQEFERMIESELKEQPKDMEQKPEDVLSSSN